VDVPHEMLRLTGAPTGGRPRILNVAPHPDDEAIGCPATMFALADAGYQVDVLACSLGRPDHMQRRRKELLTAAGRGGFGVFVPAPPINLSDRRDAHALEEVVAAAVRGICREHAPVLVLAPHPHDAHPAHELVGRAVAYGLATLPEPPPLWLWGIWADLAVPTLYSPFDDARMHEVLRVLAAHTGEVARNDYRRLVQGRSVANTVLGAERIFGFGSDAAHPFPYAELLTELAFRDGEWWGGAARLFDPAVLSAPDETRQLSWLWERPSYAADFASGSGAASAPSLHPAPRAK
jgi:LmbE family N-acetylglucosaminyl deacetylase